MSWDFETDPEFQKELDWVDNFVRQEVEPLDHILGSPYDVHNPRNQKLVRPLQAEVKKHKLWACHLGPELGGPGYGQLKLGLMNEILGRARFAPVVFGTQAPDTGNSEILAHYGTPEQKKKYLEPLLNNEIVSCFSMTEPQAGADPKMFKCKAELKGDFWVINGEKWFSSNARFSSFLIAMVVTDPDAPPYQKMSMFLVPTDTPGVNILRNVGLGTEHGDEGEHAYIRYEDVRVPRENLLGQRGQGFEVAQTRLGGGRIHHAMRTMGQVKKAFDMMCERVLSRETQGESAREQTDGARADCRLMDRDGTIPFVGAAYRLAHRQIQRLSQSAQRHCRDQSAHAQGVPRRRVSCASSSWRAWTLKRDAVLCADG